MYSPGFVVQPGPAVYSLSEVWYSPIQLSKWMSTGPAGHRIALGVTHMRHWRFHSASG